MPTEVDQKIPYLVKDAHSGKSDFAYLKIVL